MSLRSNAAGAFGGNGLASSSQGQNYERMGEIGKGAYSAVYKGRDRLNENRFVAMKEVHIRLNSEEGVPMTTVREIGLLRQLDKFEHPNVVR
jgi:serine/threonine protein kinase